MADDDDDASDPDDFEIGVTFEGPCTCGHDEEDHGWSECKVPNCPCEAGWVE